MACGEGGLEDAAARDDRYRVGAFNLRSFGPARLDDTAAMVTLVHTLKRYDLVLLMEIRDASGHAPLELLASVNAVSDAPYSMIISERLGRADYKEQYALFYRNDRVQVLDSYTYDDGIEPFQDTFEREPLVAYVEMGGLRFNVIGLHADPESVLYELNRLVQVYQDSVASSGDPDALLLGDFNADCGYLGSDELPFVRLRNDPDFVWLIDDDVDTTTSGTDCAYDRLLVTRDLLDSQMIELNSGIYDFQTDFGLSSDRAFDVSNHFPVELEFTLAR